MSAGVTAAMMKEISAVLRARKMKVEK